MVSPTWPMVWSLFLLLTSRSYGGMPAGGTGRTGLQRWHFQPYKQSLSCFGVKLQVSEWTTIFISRDWHRFRFNSQKSWFWHFSEFLFLHRLYVSSYPSLLLFLSTFLSFSLCLACKNGKFQIYQQKYFSNCVLLTCTHSPGDISSVYFPLTEMWIKTTFFKDNSSKRPACLQKSREKNCCWLNCRFSLKQSNIREKINKNRPYRHNYVIHFPDDLSYAWFLNPSNFFLPLNSATISAALTTQIN